MLSNAQSAKFDIAAPARRRVLPRLPRPLRDAVAALLPQRCTLCAASAGHALLCTACRTAMPAIERGCPRCALPQAGGELCGRCLASPPPFACTVAAWRYAFPADRLLHAFKYAGDLALAQPLADALADAVLARGRRPGAVVALPLARERQRQRGFNHACEIARRVAFRLDVPLARGLRRIRDAPPQAGLSLRARRRNVRDAFAASAALSGLHIAIVDDVMTTGATLAAAAHALHAAGAAEVDAWVVARTPLPRDRG